MITTELRQIKGTKPGTICYKVRVKTPYSIIEQNTNDMCWAAHAYVLALVMARRFRGTK